MWQSMDKHPYTGILIWLLYKPSPADMPTLMLMDLARYDSWNNTFRLVSSGASVGFQIAWQKCEIPAKPSQIEIDKQFS